MMLPTREGGARGGDRQAALLVGVVRPAREQAGGGERASVDLAHCLLLACVVLHAVLALSVCLRGCLALHRGI